MTTISTDDAGAEHREHCEHCEPLQSLRSVQSLQTLDSLADDLELIAPTVELLMSSLVYATSKLDLLGEPEHGRPIELVRAERARWRLVRALSTGDHRCQPGMARVPRHRDAGPHS